MKDYKARNAIVALEGFAISVVFHLIGGYFLAQKLEDLFPEMPLLTIAMLSSSIFSTSVTIFYLWLRLRFLPKVILNKYTLIFIISGTLVACIIAFISIIYAGSSYNLLTERINVIRYPYFFPTVSILIFFGPCLEEILYRGYFFESLRRDYGNLNALLFSSFLFTVFHGIFGGFNFSLLFVFSYSVVFTYSYIGGGIISSMIAHSVVNFYLFYINT